MSEEKIANIEELLDNVISEEQVHTNEILAMAVEKDNPLKDMLVDYVGLKLQPEDELVTVNMVAEVLAAEFPEFMFSFAEENFLRGYQVGLDDAYKSINGETPDFSVAEEEQ